MMLKLSHMLFAVLLTSTSLLVVAAPYPSSTLFQGAKFDQSTLHRMAAGSDNWASTWGPDGHLYFTWGDGNGFGSTDRGMGVARIQGPPTAISGQDLWGVPRGYFGGKAVGILSVDGALYMLPGPDAGYAAWEETWLQWSTNLGASWTRSHPELFFTKEDGFTKPTFLNFGKDYAGSLDSYVYLYGIDYSAGLPVSKLNLARVHKSQIRDRSAYQFFSGRDANGSPTWSSRVENRRPVFEDRQGYMSDSPTVIHNSAAGRYFMCKTHDTSKPNGPHGGLGIFEAPRPWGPWTTVYYQDNWLGGNNMYFCEFPTKWISNNGLTMWMVFAGYGSDPVARDAYQHIKVDLIRGDGDVPEPPVVE
jgi:hypothetical protein